MTDIPDAAIEAAAEAIIVPVDDPETDYRDIARAAIEAAMPAIDRERRVRDRLLDELVGEWTRKGKYLSARGDWPTGEAYQTCANDLRAVRGAAQ